MKQIFLTISLILSFSCFAQDKTIVVIGDSLSAGYGVTKEQAYPTLLEGLAQQRFKKEVKILNGSVSGATTAGAVSRLQWFLRAKPDLMILALGANDGLRGLSLDESQKNLEAVIELAQKNKMKVILAGMLMPENYGEDYRSQFEKMYLTLVKKYGLIFIPFLLDGVATVKELNQADGIHPNEKGHEIMAQTVLKALEPLL